MKKAITTIALCLMAFGYLNAQTFPYGINYQAVARNANGNAINTATVNLRFTIAPSTSTTTIVYQETQNAVTNSMGQFNVVIGTGSSAQTFSNVAWQGNAYNLIVEINPGSGYIIIGNQPFQSVPYALATKLKVPTVQRFTSGSGTYTTPAGVLYIEVEMVGGGGGGEGSNGAATAGGGAGGYLKFLIPSLLSVYSYSIGVGGSGGAANAANPGSNGSSTTFGSNIAGGGAGGDGSIPAVVNTFITGTEMINMQGNGGGGNIVGGGSPPPYIIGGYGGTGPFGGGTYTGDGTASNANNAPANSGSGGAGGTGSGSPGGGSGGSGGNGGSGVIIVKEYYQ
jgi:glycine rich protein